MTTPTERVSRLGVEEAASADALGAAQELLGGALPADQAEALVDLSSVSR